MCLFTHASSAVNSWLDRRCLTLLFLSFLVQFSLNLLAEESLQMCKSHCLSTVFARASGLIWKKIDVEKRRNTVTERCTALSTADMFYFCCIYCLKPVKTRDSVPWWFSYSAIVWNYNHLLWNNFYSLFHTRPFFCICTVAWWYWYVAMSYCNQ